MSDVKRLLDEATPLPWHFDETVHYFQRADPVEHYGTQLNWDYEGLGGIWLNDADPALIVYAVNRLPDYEAAVDALERLLRFTHALTAADHEAPLRAGADLDDLYAAENAIARLRESVPA